MPLRASLYRNHAREWMYTRNIVHWVAVNPAPPPEPVVPEPVTPPTAVQIGVLNMAMNDTTDTLVAFENAPLSPVMNGEQLNIDAELMVVSDASDQNNVQVTRGTPTIAHDVGAVIYSMM